MGRFLSVREINGDWVVINVDQISVIKFNKTLNCFDIRFSDARSDSVQVFQEEADKIFGLVGIAWR